MVLLTTLMNNLKRLTAAIGNFASTIEKVDEELQNRLKCPTKELKAKELKTDAIDQKKITRKTKEIVK